MEYRDHALLHFHAEIDEQIAAGHQIEAGKRRSGQNVVHREHAHVADALPDVVAAFDLGEIAAQPFGRNVLRDVLRVNAGAGPLDARLYVPPGVEVVLEANPAYWRHAPYVKRLGMKSVPEPTTRIAMLKKGEADIAYALDGEDARSVKNDPRLQLIPSKHASIFWIEFTEQWDAKSPWHDKRLRRAVNLALDRQRINEAACLGFCPPAGVIVPRVMDFALQVEPPSYDLAKAKQLLAEAGFPKGFDAGEFASIPGFPR